MKTISGGQAAVAALEQEETEVVFGLIVLPPWKSLMRFMMPTASVSSVFMMNAPARIWPMAMLRRQAGVVLAGQNGPGTTNLVTGLAQAKAAFSPVVSIAGALSTAHQYRDAFQEVDQQALLHRSPKDMDSPCR